MIPVVFGAGEQGDEELFEGQAALEGGHEVRRLGGGRFAAESRLISGGHLEGLVLGAAGQRGGGKTTALTMLTLATLGVKPAAMAWTHDAEERRKALYAVLREGAPSLVFDNIPRGTVIGCPHIERASTAEVYKDRILGVSEAPSAPAYTIIGFTGNNIRPKSDTASRSLIGALERGPDRPRKPTVRAR